jgi:hypothetical protein
MTDWRNLPAVDVAPPRPARLSQTLLSRYNVCARSAYLALTEKGAATHAMMRGSAFHAFAERAITLMIEQDEPRIPPEVAKDLLAAVLAEHPEWTIPWKERDGLRQQAYHFAVGCNVDISKIAGVETLFEMDVAGWTISGRIDRLEIDAEQRTAKIRDFKTSFAIQSQEEFEASFQVVLYALLVAYGFPTRRVECPDFECDGGKIRDAGGDWLDCPTCRGHGEIDERLDNIGAGLEFFNVGEDYSRYLRDDGTMQDRWMTLTRLELGEAMADLEQLVGQFDAALGSGLWPAVPGSHCSTCAAPALCPLPQHLRPRVINSREDAVAEAVRIEFLKDEAKAKTRELKDWAKFDGPIRYGRDRVLELAIEAKRSLDKAGLARAVTRSVELGEPFAGPDAFYKESASNAFRARTLSPAELAEERMRERDDG